MSRRKTEEDYIDLAKSRGYTWIADAIPSDVLTKTWWRCPFGHEWQSKYQKIAEGKGCPHCYGKMKRQAADYARLARQQHLTWVGGAIVNSLTPTEWMLPSGRIMLMSYARLRRRKAKTPAKEEKTC